MYQRFLGTAWWALIAADAWQVLPQMGGRRNLEELALNSVGHLKRALWAYYDDFHRDNPGVALNRLEELTVKTLGSKDSAALNTKAAETRPLLRFTALLLADKRAFLTEREAALVPAADALARFAETLRQEAGGAPTPKLHLALHLVHRIPTQGSPAAAATFVDEGANGRAAEMARGLHRATWTRRFLSFWRLLASSAGKRKLE